MIDFSQYPELRVDVISKMPDGTVTPIVFNGPNYCGDYNDYCLYRDFDQVYQFFLHFPKEGTPEYSHRQRVLV